MASTQHILGHLLVTWCLVPAALSAQEPRGSAAAGNHGSRVRQVALTFDDLPMTASGCDAGLVREVTRKLTGILEAGSVRAAGLVTPGQPCLSRDLLRETLGRWREIGALLGNHSATHPDFNATSIPDYLADLDRGQRLIDEAVGPGTRWFRPPYLHAGDEPRKHEALRAHLADRGYRVAVVTVDNQEWVYAAVYADARARGDSGLARRVADGYFEHLEASMAFYERLSLAVFGREIPQVLLLHANRLNAETLDGVLDLLARRGYTFIGLPEAVADPAYAHADPYVGPRGLSWLQRWALADGVPIPPEPREADWVARALRVIR
jgi:peptidoglycan/xylan/chitin deacetylase (PgdA/CDA1 family)